MEGAIITYQEVLGREELSFLKQKESRERKSYFKVFRIFMVVSFVVPFVGAWYRVYDGAPNAFSYSRFFATASTLLIISLIATWVGYRYKLRWLQKDIKYRSKTVEVSKITRKVHVLQNNTFHFYISSPIKLSIEVSAGDFMALNEGDELCIEYTTYSREYFGYF